MICLNCKKQIPDNSAKCPFCGAEVNFERQVVHEVRFRRIQRWIFYAILILIFLGMIGIIVKIYDSNSKLVNDIATTQNELDQRKSELAQAQTDLNSKDSALEQASSQLAQAKNDLEKKTEDYQQILNAKANTDQSLANYKTFFASTDANIYNAIVKLGVPVTNADLEKIPVADYNLNVGKDSDNDGLSDEVEAALGTNPNKADTDGDGYGDKAEILSGYDPLAKDKKLPINTAYANKMKGKILLQVESHGEAWYVNPADGKRYFLGLPEQAVETLANLGGTGTSTPATTATNATSTSSSTSQNATVNGTTSLPLGLGVK